MGSTKAGLTPQPAVVDGLAYKRHQASNHPTVGQTRLPLHSSRQLKGSVLWKHWWSTQLCQRQQELCSDDRTWERSYTSEVLYYRTDHPLEVVIPPMSHCLWHKASHGPPAPALHSCDGHEDVRIPLLTPKCIAIIRRSSQVFIQYNSAP